MCRDLKTKGACPRGVSCTFAHYEETEGDRSDVFTEDGQSLFT